MLTQFLTEYKLNGVERDTVISLLGEPANTIEFYPGGDLSQRRDKYCLSAKDEESCVLDYEAQDKVTSCRADGYSFFPSDNDEARRLLSPGAILVWRVTASSWEEAQQKKNTYLGWEPYKPMQQ